MNTDTVDTIQRTTSVDAAELGGALQWLSAACGRSHQAVFQHVLLEAERGITLARTNGDEWARAYVPAVSRGPFSVAIPAKTLLAIIDGHPGFVHLTDDSDHLTVRYGVVEATLPTMTAGAFPAFPTLDERVQSVSCPGLSAAIASVSKFVSDDIGRGPVLQGVCLRGAGDKLQVVAADGCKMLSISLDVATALDVVVPTSILKFGEFDSIDINRERVCVSNASREWCGLLINGLFPDWKKVIPHVAHSTVLDVLELTQALTAAVAITADRAYTLNLRIDAETCSVVAVGSETGSLIANISARTTNPLADSYVVGFNAKYLLQLIDAIGGDEILLEWEEAGQHRPHRITSPQVTDRFAILMPLRI